MEVAGLRDKASNANGVYALAEDEREGHRVWRQQEEASHNGHELSHDGEAWTISLADHQTKCWAFVESEEPEPHRIPAAEWQVYDGEHWVDAPAEFAVREAAEPSPAAQRPPLPSGWEVCTSRSTKRQYFLNTHVREAPTSPPRLAARLCSPPRCPQTGESQWEFPDAPAQADSGEPEAAAPAPAAAGGRGPLVREYSEGAVEAAVSKVREQLEAERRRRKQAEAALEAELRTQKQLVRDAPRLPSPDRRGGGSRGTWAWSKWLGLTAVAVVWQEQEYEELKPGGAHQPQ